MNRDIIKSIDIKAKASKVWEVLTDPQCIHIYLPGAQAVTDWEVGHHIMFVHDDREPQVVDKGTILVYQPNELLVYTYWTPFSELPDSPENYTTVAFNLSENETLTDLTITHVNFQSEAWYQTSLKGWDYLLARVRELCETD